MNNNNDTTNDTTKEKTTKEKTTKEKMPEEQVDKVFKQDSIRIVIMAVVAVLAVISLLIKNKIDSSSPESELIKNYKKTVSSNGRTTEIVRQTVSEPGY